MDNHSNSIWYAMEDVLEFYADTGVAELLQPEEDLCLHKPRSGDGYKELCQEIRECRKCPLSRSRKHAVPGEGCLDAKLMFVGEGPGRDEDIQGRPFVGEAGRLLSRIIEAMKFSREDVYITNVVKCRPPGNRNPLPDEIDSCQYYLFRQIEMIQPEVIVTLGNVPTRFLLNTSAGITALRGKFHAFRNIKIMPTFHPSYLVRRKEDKKLKIKVWSDMQKVMALLGKK